MANEEMMDDTGAFAVTQHRNSQMNVVFKAIDSKATAPTYATEGAAAFDLASAQDGSMRPRSGMVVKTGLAVEVPEGYALLIYSRSGMGFKNSIRLGNCVGVIDSDYRGEIMVKLQNDSDAHFHFAVGDRIAQGMLVKAPQVNIVMTSDDLSLTLRGVGGLGSTGV